MSNEDKIKKFFECYNLAESIEDIYLKNGDDLFLDENLNKDAGIDMDDNTESSDNWGLFNVKLLRLLFCIIN